MNFVQLLQFPRLFSIGWTRWNGDATSKNNLSFPTSFGRDRSQGICRICDLQALKDIWHHFTTDVSYFRPRDDHILDHMIKIMEVNRKSAWNGSSLGLGSYQVALKSQVSLSRNFLAVLVFVLMSQLMSCKCFLVVLWQLFSVIVKVMIVSVEMFANWKCIGIFGISSVVIEPTVECCFWFTDLLNVADVAF